MMGVLEGTLEIWVNTGEVRVGKVGVKIGRTGVGRRGGEGVVIFVGALVTSAKGVCRTGGAKLNIGAGITCTNTGCGATKF